MAQLEGRHLAVWLASEAHEPDRVVGLEVESTVDEAWGRIVQVRRDGVEIETETGRRFLSGPMLRYFVVQMIPVGLKRQIEAGVTGVPVALTEAVKAHGFDPLDLGGQEVRLLMQAVEAVEGAQECPFEAIQFLGALLGSHKNGSAAHAALQELMDLPFKNAAGAARIQLARAASARGEKRTLLDLTKIAFAQGASDPALTEGQRAILLTIRAACVAQLALSCTDLREAEHAARTAYSINGKSEELSNTYNFIKRRMHKLGCQE